MPVLLFGQSLRAVEPRLGLAPRSARRVADAVDNNFNGARPINNHVGVRV